MAGCWKIFFRRLAGLRAIFFGNYFRQKAVAPEIDIFGKVCRIPSLLPEECPSFPLFSPLVSFSRVLEAEGERGSFLLRPGNKSEICTNLRSVFSQISSPFPLSRQFEKGGEQRTLRVWFGIFLPGLPLASHIGPIKALHERTQRDLYIYPRYHHKKRHFYSAAVVKSSGSVFDFFKRANCYLWETERRGKAFFAKSVWRHHAMCYRFCCVSYQQWKRGSRVENIGEKQVCVESF